MAGLFTTLVRRVPQLVKNVHSVNNTPKLLRNFSVGSFLRAPVIQEAAPDFKGTAVIEEEFKEIQLSDYKGKYVVLFFYPLDFTFVCPTELIAFDEKVADFKKINTEIIGCSVDSHYSHLAWQNTDRKKGGLGKLHYPLLSDIHKKIACDYGVLIKEAGIALRGTFIIDPKGVLRQMSVNDLPIGRSVDEVYRLVEALRFVEEHGEVCPANWHKGSLTIKPTPEESKEYFEAANK